MVQKYRQTVFPLYNLIKIDCSFEDNLSLACGGGGDALFGKRNGLIIFHGTDEMAFIECREMVRDVSVISLNHFTNAQMVKETTRLEKLEELPCLDMEQIEFYKDLRTKIEGSPELNQQREKHIEIKKETHNLNQDDTFAKLNPKKDPFPNTNLKKDHFANKKNKTEATKGQNQNINTSLFLAEKYKKIRFTKINQDVYRPLPSILVLVSYRSGHSLLFLMGDSFYVIYESEICLSKFVRLEENIIIWDGNKIYFKPVKGIIQKNPVGQKNAIPERRERNSLIYRIFQKNNQLYTDMINKEKNVEDLLFKGSLIHVLKKSNSINKEQRRNPNETEISLSWGGNVIQLPKFELIRYFIFENVLILQGKLLIFWIETFNQNSAKNKIIIKKKTVNMPITAIYPDFKVQKLYLGMANGQIGILSTNDSFCILNVVFFPFYLLNKLNFKSQTLERVSISEMKLTFKHTEMLLPITGIIAQNNNMMFCGLNGCVGQIGNRKWKYFAIFLILLIIPLIYFFKFRETGFLDK